MNNNLNFSHTQSYGFKCAFLFFLKIVSHCWPSTFNERKNRSLEIVLNISLYIPQKSHTGLKPFYCSFNSTQMTRFWQVIYMKHMNNNSANMRVLNLQTYTPIHCSKQTETRDKEKQMQWRSTIAVPLSDAWNSRLDILYQCMHEAELFLTEHREDEVLGRVDLERSLVVILPLLVLAEFGDQAVELLYPGTGPEVQLGGLRDVFGAVRGGCGAAASWTSPAGERRRRHVREETAESKHRSARAVLGAGGREWCAHRTNGRRSADATEHWFVSLLDKHCLSKQVKI